MSIPGRIYDLALRGLRGIAPYVVGGSGKVGRGVEGRRRDRGTFREWAEEHRDPERPLVWFHAPSVGEGLQARAVLDALRRERPDVQLAYSFFSPSAEGMARRLQVDVAAYLPWDVQVEVGPTLDALRPDLVVFTKTEVWPGLTAAARRRGVPVLLVAATLPPNAGRLRWPGRLLLRRTFRVLERVVTISAEDGARFQELGVRPDRVAVAGDPAMDAVLERVRATDPEAPYLRALLAGPPALMTLVAGSTWGPDEEVLIPAVTGLREVLKARGGTRGEERGTGGTRGADESPGTDEPRRTVEPPGSASEGAGTSGPDRADPATDSPIPLRIIIAPHEPDAEHLEPLEARLRTFGWETQRLSRRVAPPSNRAGDDPGPPLAEAIIIDRVGVLAELYTLADVAFVGGGFGTDGLHSVLEPAAAGVPVLFGPNHHNARAAGELESVGGGLSVADEDSLLRALRMWVPARARDPADSRGVGPSVRGTDSAESGSARHHAGTTARRYLEAHQGASSATARILDDLISHTRSSKDAT